MLRSLNQPLLIQAGLNRMTDIYLRQSPLAHLNLNARAANEPNNENVNVKMGERPLLGMINLRGQSHDPAFFPAVKKSLGSNVPKDVNLVTGNPEGIHTLCLGPDEWMIITPPGEEIKLCSKLRVTLSNLHTAITLTGDSRTTIRLSGIHARDTLAKGCSIDLHPRAFGLGQCAQTVLARADMILHQTAEESSTNSATYDIIVLRSYAEYIWTWLEDAAQEYGLQVLSAAK